MPKRYASIWFYHLLTDWMARHQPDLRAIPFVLSAADHGRMVVKAVNDLAQEKGIFPGMVVADCRAIFPDLRVIDYPPQQAEKLLNALAEWCIRFTPIAAIDLPDGLVLDISGCTHLWKGEKPYRDEIQNRLRQFGYQVNIAVADTIASAWAVCRYGKSNLIVEPGEQVSALLSLPPSALRLEQSIVEKLEKLGLQHIGSFINMPQTALRRRFGMTLLHRLGQARGSEIELLEPVQPPAPYEERLPCMEPIRTATGIEIALQQLLETLCRRLAKEGNGLRNCTLNCYRVDGNIQKIQIGTNRPSRSTAHLFKLFQIKVSQLEPALGFELFVLQSTIIEEISMEQEALWAESNNDDIEAIGELLDKISGKVGQQSIRRYLPAEHYWPERSIKTSTSLVEKATTAWRKDLPRPLHLLSRPQLIEVTVPIPDYPPMLFRYRGTIHEVKKADGPERIEQEWWIEEGLFRDYYCVEDQDGKRYWLFRLGSYHTGEPKWFVHGFFA
ncbi:MAG: DNA polymerase Y family protein [Daejeonella sp.]